MTRQTVATTNARIDNIEASIGTLAEAVQFLVAQEKARNEQPLAVRTQTAKAPKAPKVKPLVDPCPEYATAAQRAEYDKLAARAMADREKVAKALGTEAIRCFIPVSKKNAAAMPHSIQWTASYSK